MVLKDKLVMKKVCMLLLWLFICNIGLVLAQGRRFEFELGANYPIGLQNGYKENHVGFYLNGIYRFSTNPLSVNLKLGYESYTIGVSIDNIDVGVFNEGYKLHFAVAPQVGIRFINHINVYLQYYVTHKDFSRLVLGVGYVFWYCPSEE